MYVIVYVVKQIMLLLKICFTMYVMILYGLNVWNKRFYFILFIYTIIGNYHNDEFSDIFSCLVPIYINDWDNLQCASKSIQLGLFWTND